MIKVEHFGEIFKTQLCGEEDYDRATGCTSACRTRKYTPIVSFRVQRAVDNFVFRVCSLSDPFVNFRTRCGLCIGEVFIRSYIKMKRERLSRRVWWNIAFMVQSRECLSDDFLRRYGDQLPHGVSEPNGHDPEKFELSLTHWKECRDAPPLCTVCYEFSVGEQCIAYSCKRHSFCLNCCNRIVHCPMCRARRLPTTTVGETLIMQELHRDAWFEPVYDSRSIASFRTRRNSR